MAFNKLFFFVLVIASCALAMPVHDSSRHLEAAANAGVKVDDSTLLADNMEETTVTSAEDVTTVKEETSSVAQPAAAEALDLMEAENTQETLMKRSIEEESSNDEDMETAAGTNLLRPLFVYRQQVAYRQRVRNANRRGNRNRF